MASFSRRPTSPQRKLPAGGQIQTQDAEAEEAQGAGDEFFAGQEEAGQPVDLELVGDRLLDGDLAGQGGEVSPAQLELDCSPVQSLASQSKTHLLRQPAQGLP